MARSQAADGSWTPDLVRISPAEGAEARGVVVVIDVIRAFTVAAQALDRGAERLWMVNRIEDALALKQLLPEALLAGERGGRLVPGFDLNNSPFRMSTAPVADRTVIQCTGAGTRGAMAAANAGHILVAALVNAVATARYAALLSRQERLPIALMPTSSLERGEIEDQVCADYLDALLVGADSAEEIGAAGLDRLRRAPRVDPFAAADVDFPVEDLELCFAVNRFDFAMEGQRLQQAAVTFVEVIRVDPRFAEARRLSS